MKEIATSLKGPIYVPEIAEDWQSLYPRTESDPFPQYHPRDYGELTPGSNFGLHNLRPYNFRDINHRGTQTRIISAFPTKDKTPKGWDQIDCRKVYGTDKRLLQIMFGMSIHELPEIDVAELIRAKRQGIPQTFLISHQGEFMNLYEITWGLLGEPQGSIDLTEYVKMTFINSPKCPIWIEGWQDECDLIHPGVEISKQIFDHQLFMVTKGRFNAEKIGEI
jgi:hypothetical protein